MALGEENTGGAARTSASSALFIPASLFQLHVAVFIFSNFSYEPIIHSDESLSGNSIFAL